jgi:hypothetical protein
MGGGDGESSIRSVDGRWLRDFKSVAWRFGWRVRWCVLSIGGSVAVVAVASRKGSAMPRETPPRRNHRLVGGDSNPFSARFRWPIVSSHFFSVPLLQPCSAPDRVALTTPPHAWLQGHDVMAGWLAAVPVWYI